MRRCTRQASSRTPVHGYVPVQQIGSIFARRVGTRFAQGSRKVLCRLLGAPRIRGLRGEILGRCMRQRGEGLDKACASEQQAGMAETGTGVPKLVLLREHDLYKRYVYIYTFTSRALVSRELYKVSQ